MRTKVFDTLDEEFEAYRQAFESGEAEGEDIGNFYMFMETFGEHWNGESWTYECNYPTTGTHIETKQTWYVSPTYESIFGDDDWGPSGFHFSAGKTEYNRR